MRIRILVFMPLFLLFFIRPSFAAWDKPRLRLTELYHYDLRVDNHRFLSSRASLTFSYLDANKASLFKIIPFFEGRRNIDRDIWERKEAGAEIGKDIFPWLYLGEAVQRVWMNEDYQRYGQYEKREYTESESRLLLSHKLLSTRFLVLKGFILNEYTYDFNAGKGVRNEVAIGIVIPLGKYLETQANWRHIDRVHFYDSDTVEGALTLAF